MGVHVEVGLHEPVVRKRDDVAQLQRQHGLIETLLLTQKLRFKPRLHQRHVVLRSPCDFVTQFDILLCPQCDSDPIGMVIVLVGNEVYLAIVLQTFCRIKDGIYAMGEVDIEIEPLPHGHCVYVVVFDGFQIGITRLQVQAVLINDITAQQPVRRTCSALGIAE